MGTQNFDFYKCKYGLFVHYVHGLSMFSDGRTPKDINETLDSFDVNGFARDVADMGVQFLIFTSWHKNTIPLYPSEVTAKWRGCDIPRRDLLGEIIDAVNAEGVKVILYTHPRDGHDFSSADRAATGWGEGAGVRPANVNPLTFNNEKWEEYIIELYTEFADRYAHKLYGFYTDGLGPCDGTDPAMENNLQVINYLKLRDIMKSRNPDIIMIQNYFGNIFSNDFAMPEGYFGYEEDTLKYRVEQLPAAEKALAMSPYDGSWMPGLCFATKTEDFCITPEDNAIKFVLFNASCTVGGGTVYATGPYCEGNVWISGVLDYLKAVGKKVNEYKESVLDAKVSASYPTISGDTLESLDYKFFMTSDDEKYEYLHVMKPTDRITLGESLDGAVLTNPVSLTSELEIESFDGKTLTLSGSFDEIDSVIRFERSGGENAPIIEWINNSDKRIRYSGNWKCYFLENQELSLKITKGCFESDLHRAMNDGETVFVAFEGSVLEIYARGGATLFIDGVNVGRIDCSNESNGRRNLAFTSINLHGGWHTLYMVADENFDFDALRIIK